MIADMYVQMMGLTPEEAAELAVLKDRVLDVYPPSTFEEPHDPWSILWYAQLLGGEAWKLTKKIRENHKDRWFEGLESVSKYERELNHGEHELTSKRFAEAWILLRAVWWHVESVRQARAEERRYSDFWFHQRGELFVPRVYTYAKSRGRWFGLKTGPVVFTRDRADPQMRLEGDAHPLIAQWAPSALRHKCPEPKAALYSAIFQTEDFQEVHGWRKGRDYNYRVHEPSVRRSP